MGYHRILSTTTVHQLEDLILDVHDLDKACVDNGIRLKQLSTQEKVTKLWNIILQKKKEQATKAPKIAVDDYDRRFDALNKKAMEKLEHARFARLLAHKEADEVLEAWEEKILDELNGSRKQLSLTRSNQEKAKAKSKKAYAEDTNMVAEAPEEMPKAQVQKQTVKDIIPATVNELSCRSRVLATPSSVNNVKIYLEGMGAQGVADIWASENNVIIRFDTFEDAIQGYKALEGYRADGSSLDDEWNDWVARKVKAEKKKEKQAGRTGTLKRTIGAAESDDGVPARPAKKSKTTA